MVCFLFLFTLFREKCGIIHVHCLILREDTLLVLELVDVLELVQVDVLVQLFLLNLSQPVKYINCFGR